MLIRKQNLIYALKFIKKRHLLVLPSIIIFTVFMVITSLSIANTNLIDKDAFAQSSNQTLPPTNTSSNGNSLVPTSMSKVNTSKITNSIDTINSTSLVMNEASTITNSSNKQITLITEDVEIDIAPGKRVTAWAFNGTVPGPTIRLTEGENLTIKYINKSPIPHTIHFHGNHDDVNDGVIPQVLPGQTYLYNITGEPAGALMYHCHAPPTSLHIRMGMYGALIVDPVDKQQIAPAKEFVMTMGEYSLEDQMGLEADYYTINGFADQYMHNPLQINHDDLMRIYVINLGTTIPASFHLHSTTFLAYPSGLWDNLPIHAQTVSVAPGDASIVEAKWKYPGTYLFHAHGIQEEKGNMGQINVVGQDDLSEELDIEVGNSNNTNTTTTTSNFQQQSENVSEPLTRSVSMFDWQYELQKKLQNPKVIAESQNKEIDDTRNIQTQGENQSISLDKTLATNITGTNTANSSNLASINNTDIRQDEKRSESGSNQISIVSGSASPSSTIFYDPSHSEVELGTEVTWINDDANMPHTVTSGNAGDGPTGVFDSGIIMGDGSSYKHIFDKGGEYEYYCTLHPWMVATISVK
jgi:nitrite reductase (NO-forming)